MQKHKKCNIGKEIDQQNDKENADSNNSNAISNPADTSIITISDDEVQHKCTYTSHAAGAKSGKQSLLFSGGYFEIISKDSAGFKAKCLTCGVAYSASNDVTSNLTTHLKVRIFVYFCLFH